MRFNKKGIKKEELICLIIYQECRFFVLTKDEFEKGKKFKVDNFEYTKDKLGSFNYKELIEKLYEFLSEEELRSDPHDFIKGLFPSNKYQEVLKEWRANQNNLDIIAEAYYQKYYYSESGIGVEELLCDFNTHYADFCECKYIIFD